MTDDDLSSPAQQDAPMRVIAIASGKGGVGKTNVTANLSISLAMQGQRVSIIDADTSLGNINILMGIKPKYTLEHMLSGEKTLPEILAAGPNGIRIIPAASGITELANLKKNQLQRLTKSLRELEQDFDYLMIDTAAGINQQVMQFIQSARYTIVVISPEPTSLTDAFALIKTLQEGNYKHPIYILVNMVRNFAASIDIYKDFEATIREHLTSPVHYLGYVPEDDAVKQAVCAQQPVLLHDPTTPASRSFITIAHAINRHFHLSDDDYNFASFWEQSLTVEEEPTEPEPPIAEAPEPDPILQSEPNPAPERSTAAPTNKPRSAAMFLQQMATAELNDKQLQQLTQILINTSLKRFKKLPFEINEMIYRELELNDFQEEDIQHLVRALRSLYQKRHNKPLDDPEQAIIEEFSRLDGAEDKMQDVLRQLQQLYSEKCGVDDSSPKLNLPSGFSGIHRFDSNE